MYVRFLVYQPNNFILVPKISELSDDIFTPLFVLFLIAKTWKPTRYLSADEWIKGMGICTKRILYSSSKKVFIHDDMNRTRRPYQVMSARNRITGTV